MPNELSDNAALDQAVTWFIRLQAKDVSVDERRAFLRWLNEKAEHRQAYAAVNTHWQWMEPLKDIPFPARQEALNYRPRPRYRITAYAAALVLFCLGVSAFWWQAGMVFPHTYQVAKGNRQAIVLADGSTLELNTESRVKVSMNPWRRDVELLQGEAFFQVKHDNDRPFRVKAGQGLITDIGTAFEVYRQPGRVLVAVQEGVVEVETKKRRRLSAGQQIAFGDSGEFIDTDQQPVASLTAWRRGQLVFNARRLDDALAEMARYHNKQVRLEDNTLAAMRISGAFPSDRLEGMLNALARILPLRIEWEGNNKIVIRRSIQSKS